MIYPFEINIIAIVSLNWIYMAVHDPCKTIMRRLRAFFGEEGGLSVIQTWYFAL